MILSRHDIQDAINRGDIQFDPPIEEKQIGEASIDLRLGSSFTKFKNRDELSDITVSVANGLGSVGSLKLWNTKELRLKDEFGNPERFVLRPNEFVLALTHEKVRIPSTMIAIVEGRSTYARVGLSMHQTAPWIQPGWNGRITLEIMNHGPINIELTPFIDRPCQITFFELKSGVEKKFEYGSKSTDHYQHQHHPLDHDKK